MQLQQRAAYHTLPPAAPDQSERTLQPQYGFRGRRGLRLRLRLPLPALPQRPQKLRNE